MGKTKIKTIDDSVAAEEPKKKAPKKVLATNIERDQALKKAKSESDKAVGAVELTKDQEVQIEDTQQKVGGSVTQAPSATKTASEKPKQKKQGQPRKRSKKYQKTVEEFERGKHYSIPEAVELSKKLSYSKFTGSLEIHINTQTTGLRGLVSLPYSEGKKLRILAFGKDAQESGADIVGTDETLEEISKGKIDFDMVITTPLWMSKLAKVAKVLGPKGLMPNPKNGTITSPSADGLKKAVENFQGGKTEYKSEPKAPIIHLALGKLNQPSEELTANVKTLLITLGKSRIKKVTLSPTLGPGVKVDLSSI
ncbi:50S ribosomal protein L1 [Candidatus Daviesbacteria bacterium]|nr:50S ribosomal protein L1 [Candidatus Daviesbacteria bacterium]